MGKNKNKLKDIYETIPAVSGKDPSKSPYTSQVPPAPPLPPDQVRYVRDPLIPNSNGITDSNYSFHITYHNKGPSEGGGVGHVGQYPAANTAGPPVGANTYATTVPGHGVLAAATLPHNQQQHYPRQFNSNANYHKPPPPPVAQRTHTLPTQQRVPQALTLPSNNVPQLRIAPQEALSPLSDYPGEGSGLLHSQAPQQPARIPQAPPLPPPLPPQLPPQLPSQLPSQLPTYPATGALQSQTLLRNPGSEPQPEVLPNPNVPLQTQTLRPGKIPQAPPLPNSGGVGNNQISTHHPQRTQTLQAQRVPQPPPLPNNNASVTLVRSSTEKPRKVTYEDTLAKVEKSGNNLNGRLHHITEGNSTPAYDPTLDHAFTPQSGVQPGISMSQAASSADSVNTSANTSGKSSGKHRKTKKGGCSCPPWWGWLIIILVFALLGAVLYFIFGRLLKPTLDDGESDLLGKKSTTLPSLPVVTEAETTSSSASTTATTTTMQASTSTTTTTTTTSTTATETTTSTTQVPTTTITRPPPGNYHDDIITSFEPTEDTRSLRSAPSSSRKETSARNLYDCFRDCLDYELSPCYGVDYNSQWLTCHLLINYDYRLEPIGTTPQIHNYRRIFNVRPFCQDSLYFHIHRTFANGVRYRLQPEDVDTLGKCRLACLGPFGNGVFTDGYTCTAGVFDSSIKRCKITDVAYHPNTLTDADSTEHFQYDGVQCVRPPLSACSTKFNPVRNRQPLDLDRKFLQPGIVTVPMCAEKCLNYRPQNAVNNTTCQGFAFTYNIDKPECVLYTGSRNSALGNVQKTDFYGINPPECSRCGYLHYQDTSATGAHPLSATSIGDCRDQCNRWRHDIDEDSTCYGYDVRTTGSDIDCHVYTKGALPSSDRSITTGTDLYVWDSMCHDCSPSQFIPTSHTSPFGGAPNGRRSLPSCARSCQISVSPPNEKRCHGFSHDRITKDCTLFYEYDYELNGIGSSESSDHYRRMYSCTKDPSSACVTYVHTENSQPPLAGFIQPWDILTVDRCKDRCTGYSTFNNGTCYGVVFDRTLARCKIYIGQHNPNQILEDAPGLDFYLRNATC